MKKTKKSLVFSLFALVLCVAMLAGSTMAWFTDSASNTGNRIQAGNLDVDLLMYKESEYVSIAGGQGDIFQEADIAKNSNETLWEPGKTQVVFLAVQNNGNLAVKYNVYIDVTDEGLVDSLEYAWLGGVTKDMYDAASITSWDSIKEYVTANPSAAVVADMEEGRQVITTGVLDEIIKGSEGECDYIALAVHMKEDADNTFQGEDAMIDVPVVGTQMNAEEDAFGPDYDKDANAIEPVAPIHNKVETDKIVESSSEETAEFDAVGDVKSASVSMSAAKELIPGTGTIVAGAAIVDGDEVGIKLELNVETVETASASITYEIELNQTTYVKSNDVERSETNKVDSLSDWLTATIDVGKNLKNVSVQHSGIAMQKLASVDATPTENAGGFFYDAGSGVLTIKSKSFSPFVVSYDVIKESDGIVYNTTQDKFYKEANALETAISEVKDGETLLLLQDTELPSKQIKTPISFTLDLGNKTLTINKELNFGYDNNYQKHAVEETIKNGKIILKTSGAYLRFENGSKGYFENLNIEYGLTGTTKALQTYATNESGESVINEYKFTNCNFKNVNLNFEGKSGSTNNYNVLFNNCSFDVTTSQNGFNVVTIDDYDYGTFIFKNTGFILTGSATGGAAYCVNADTYLSYVNGNKVNVTFENVSMKTFGNSNPYTYRYLSYNSQYSENAVITETGNNVYQHNNVDVELTIKETSATNKTAVWVENAEAFQSCYSEWVSYAKANPACASYNGSSYYLVESNGYYFVGGQGQQFVTSADIQIDGSGNVTQVKPNSSYTYKTIGVTDISEELGVNDNTNVHIYTLAN